MSGGEPVFHGRATVLLAPDEMPARIRRDYVITREQAQRMQKRDAGRPIVVTLRHELLASVQARLSGGVEGESTPSQEVQDAPD